jgi:hypothetical protein
VNPGSGEAPLDGEDVALLDRIAALYARVDPVPPDLADRIDLALSLADLDSELARLEEDLLAPAGARSVEHARSVTFASTNLTVMVTITALAPDRYRLDGWCAPGQPLRVELRRHGGCGETETDDGGRFEFDQVHPGRVQLVFYPVAGSELRHPVVTPAVEL